MKLQLLALALSLSISVQSQIDSTWKINGNAASIGSFVGTTNSEPLILKANNIVGLRIKPNGELIIKGIGLGHQSCPWKHYRKRS